MFLNLKNIPHNSQTLKTDNYYITVALCSLIYLRAVPINARILSSIETYDDTEYNAILTQQ